VIDPGSVEYRSSLARWCGSPAQAVPQQPANRSVGTARSGSGWVMCWRWLEVSVRGGGHNVAGLAVTDGGLMIDLAPMKRIRVDPVPRARKQT
jgi:FAD/FMN-containing dehydrogenase